MELGPPKAAPARRRNYFDKVPCPSMCFQVGIKRSKVLLRHVTKSHHDCIGFGMKSGPENFKTHPSDGDTAFSRHAMNFQ